MGFFLVMKAELVRTWIVTRRYWFRSITGLVVGWGMLVGMVLVWMQNHEKVNTAVTGMGDAEAATKFVLGFIIGTFAFGVVGMFTQGLQSMATTGVLEQLCMSPHGLITNFMAQTFVASVSSILSSSLMVFLVVKFPAVGGTLHWDTIPVFVLLTLTFCNLLGFGFMVGGLVLVFKQVGQLAFLIRFALFGIAVVADESLVRQPWFASIPMHLLPVTDASICLKYVLVKGQANAAGVHISVFQHSSFYWLLANCFIWTFIGLAVFKVMEDYSRSKGTLGTY